MLPNGGYKIATVYKWLRQEPAKVIWRFWVWNKFNIPKNSFICWLTMWNRLKTKQRLHRFGIYDDNSCAICGNAPETIAHLFFECQYGQACVEGILQWIQFTANSRNIHTLWRRVFRSRKLSKFKRLTVGLPFQLYCTMYGEPEMMPFGITMSQLCNALSSKCVLISRRECNNVC